MLYPKILTKNQKEVLEKNSFLKNKGFYLAGGTGLALQLGHRTSIDLDFYTRIPFLGKSLGKQIQKVLPSFKVLQEAKGTLQIEAKKTEASFFFYDYPLINPLKNFEATDLASIEDIAAMKIIALVQRGTKRDFIDLYFLLKEFSLAKLVKFTQKKYPNYDEMLILRALIFFEDAENETKKRPIKVFEKGFSWLKVKDYIFRQVKTYQLSFAKKKF